MLEKVIEKGEEIGKAFSISIVDGAGDIKAFAGMDGAQILTKDIARDKAYSAAAFSRPTHEWYNRIKDDEPLLHGMVHTPRLIIFGGGYPIKIDGDVIGGIGVSGGHYTEDMEVCQAALEVAEND
ncbi:heme-binding protein [Alteribacillus sp. YIM 98480]|uniref:GlcG/HbpS family heme-binding protein n=1 Tax=Alteribacillus sp. YIM 98480 TaxID=2606599 RepID=UPI00131C9F61|nr:heme-binding protein [Alteribacillus sp. YIM 98480]